MAEEERKPEEGAQDAPASGASEAPDDPPAETPSDAPSTAEDEGDEKPDAKEPASEDEGDEKPDAKEPGADEEGDEKPDAKEPAAGGEEEAKPAEKPNLPVKKAAAPPKKAAVKKEEEPPKKSSNEDVNSVLSRFSGRATHEPDVEPDIPALRVEPGDLVEALTFLKDDRRYDHLACLTAIDWTDRFEVVYNLWSYYKNRALVVRVNADHEDPVVPSVTSLWKGADWLEREEYDLMGIRFDGHPDLRRILLPEGWRGHPLRKDYDSKQEQYVGMNSEGEDVVYASPREDAW